MKPETSPDTLAIPPALLAQIRSEAEKEHVPADEVLREIAEQGDKERRWQKLRTYERIALKVR